MLFLLFRSETRFVILFKKKRLNEPKTPRLNEQEALKLFKGLGQNGTAATRLGTALGGADKQLLPSTCDWTLEHRPLKGRCMEQYQTTCTVSFT